VLTWTLLVWSYERRVRWGLWTLLVLFVLLLIFGRD